jgi:hypothetical protein
VRRAWGSRSFALNFILTTDSHGHNTIAADTKTRRQTCATEANNAMTSATPRKPYWRAPSCSLFVPMVRLS